MALRWLAAGAALAVIGTISCSSTNGPSEPSENAARASAAIQGGTTDTTHTFAVGIANTNLSGGVAICSGALIAPNLVVTARHCVDNISSDTVDCAQTKFQGRLGPNSGVLVTTDSTISQTSRFRQAIEVDTPTPTSVCGNDIALIILDSNVPGTEATPITPDVQYKITDPRLSTNYTAIGYGAAGPNDPSSAGVRRIVQNLSIYCIPNDPPLDCYSDPTTKSLVATQEFVGGDGTCQGDSGSSAYEQKSFNSGAPISLGVLSRGGQNATDCIGSIYTRLDSWSSLIIQTALTAAQDGSYPPPPWTGSESGQDAGSASDGGPTPGSLGAPCSSDQDCSTHNCKAVDSNSFTCTQACQQSSDCPSGFHCVENLCFAGSDPPPATNSAQDSGTRSGCAVAPVGKTGPADPIPWRWTFGLVLGALAVRLRLRLRLRHGRRRH